ncbi:unnamed protein product [Phaedon cochleariae]|uniref:DUF4200 domain-containing protein n=1 Tax=Phaedon cochleariae TaxID=80249 RepID=A0A9P0DK21_PHACE|nr:unnamed protein product [Phaedon cochleariae]
MSLYDTSIFPKSNHGACAEYFTSINTTKLLKNRTSRCTDDTNRNVYIGYHLAQKDLCKAEIKLRAKTAEASKHRQVLEDQWKKLAESEKQFRETFQDFNKFVIENGEKRLRATKKIEEKEKLLDQRVKRITDLQSEMGQLEEIKKYMDEGIVAMKIYENFLIKVVNKYPNQFTSVMDIVERYESLLLARKELSAMQAIAMNRYDAARSEFDKVTKENHVEIAGLKNKLSELHLRYEKAQQTSQKWESVHHLVNLGTIEKLRQTEIVKESCRQIYRNICERKGIPPIHENDYMKQFEIIKKCLRKHELVNEMVQNLEEEKLKLSEKPCLSDTTD